jgi:hypothetical protein
VKNASIVFTGLLASVLLAGAPAAVHADSSVPPKADAGLAKIADKDFGHLSTDGVSAFNDLHLARIAIFDGRTDEAAKLITDAQASLGKAKTDSAVFLKAESALHPPAQATPKPSATQANSTTPVAWIPIDADIVLGETFQATPEKAAAVVTAKKGLEKGDTAKSLEAIKLASVDVNYTLAVAPLDQSVADLDEANALMTKHDYYGASQSLKKAEDGIRYDEIDDIADVKNHPSTASASAK